MQCIHKNKVIQYLEETSPNGAFKLNSINLVLFSVSAVTFTIFFFITPNN